MCSSPPPRAPKLQIAIGQSLTGGHWNLPKKDTPCPKIKKQQEEGRRGAIMIKSNLIPTGWVTHKLENNISKKFSHCHEGSEPYARLPNQRN